MIDYRIDRLSVIGRSAFTEASREELRTLLALVELGGRADSESALAEAAKVSPARCKAALAFWEESEVIFKADSYPIVTSEFEERLTRGQIDEVDSVEVAESIRNEGLASMIEECAILMGQATLPAGEVKLLCALYTQYSLSPEYIVTLAAYMAAGGNLTTRRLCNEAIKISSKGIDSAEALDGYIKDRENDSGAEWEFRRVLGIYGRNLSKSEKEYFKKWSEEFGYSVEVVSEAYDIAVLNSKSGRGDLRYMDTILSAWHKGGCRTVSDCRQAELSRKAARDTERTATDKKKGAKAAKDAPRYGNFDINKAFNDAVARSFGETDGKEEG